jgi:hypothetical protein
LLQMFRLVHGLHRFTQFAFGFFIDILHFVSKYSNHTGLTVEPVNAIYDALPVLATCKCKA